MSNSTVIIIKKQTSKNYYRRDFKNYDNEILANNVESSLSTFFLIAIVLLGQTMIKLSKHLLQLSKLRLTNLLLSPNYLEENPN